MHRPTIDDAFDENGLLKDGHVFRVRMSMKDAMKMRDNRPVLHDGRGGVPGHRPGFVMTDNSAAKRRLDDAYRDYERDLVSAYKTQDQDNPPIGEGSKGPRGQQVGDPCTINGWPGHLKMVNGKMTCIPDRQSFNGSNDDDDDDPERAQSDRAKRKADAYAQYDAALTNAWRNVRG
jgi:hypothetical protein